MLKKLPQGSIAPKGWLLKRLESQAEGLSGHMAELFPDVGDNSAWLGGTGEAWERGVYYLDGLVPLAYLLKNKTLIATVERWINAILARKNDRFGFGPTRSNDYWPRMVAAKALIGYYRATGDERVISFLTDYFRFVYENIDKTGLYFWAAARSLEAFEAIYEVYLVTNEPFLLELCEKYIKHGYDWDEYFSEFRYTKSMDRYASWRAFNLGKKLLAPIDKINKSSQKEPKPHIKERVDSFNNKKLVRLIMLTHGVNIAMAYKYPAYMGVIRNDERLKSLAYDGYERVMKYHGLANGLHSSDEHLMGTDAGAGVELCTVVEAAYSFEESLRLTKDMRFAELTEYIVFNAMLATFTEDMTAHQYVQQTNQCAADIKPRQFYDTDKEANIFGVAPNFGCCAANMHQGFPKFAENLIYTDENRLYLFVYSPFSAETVLAGQEVGISMDTNYPFSDSIEVTLSKGENVPVTLRVPPFAENIRLNGKIIKKYIPVTEFTLSAGDKVTIECKKTLEKIENPDGSISFRRNNLLMCMPIAHEERYVRGDMPFHYREFVPTENFIFAPETENGLIYQSSKLFSDESKELSYTVKGHRVTNWRLYKNSLGSPPKAAKKGQTKYIKLIPYGLSVLRVTQFPKV